MNTLTKPLPDRLGEIETEEEEAAYAAWMRKMVQEADDDPRVAHLIATMKERHRQQAAEKC